MLLSQNLNRRLIEIENVTMEALSTMRSIEQTLEDHIFKTEQEVKHGHSKPGVIFTNIGDGKRKMPMAEVMGPSTDKRKTKFAEINLVDSANSEDEPNVQGAGPVKHGKAGELNFRKRAGKTVAITDPYFSEVDTFAGGKSWTKNNPTGTEFYRGIEIRVDYYKHLFL